MAYLTIITKLKLRYTFRFTSPPLRSPSLRCMGSDYGWEQFLTGGKTQWLKPAWKIASFPMVKTRVGNSFFYHGKMEKPELEIEFNDRIMFKIEQMKTQKISVYN